VESAGEIDKKESKKYLTTNKLFERQPEQRNRGIFNSMYMIPNQPDKHSQTSSDIVGVG
jgi:hypothetical protein